MKPFLNEITICDQIRPRRTYLINGKPEKIVRFIPMQNREGMIEDIEILLDKKQNRYFSWNLFKNGKSWVKNIYEVKVSRL